MDIKKIVIEKRYKNKECESDYLIRILIFYLPSPLGPEDVTEDLPEGFKKRSHYGWYPRYTSHHLPKHMARQANTS